MKIMVKDRVRIRGRVRVTVRDTEGKLIEQRPWSSNLVTDAGEALFAALMGGESVNPCAYCGVGGGSTPAQETDTALGSELGRIEFTNTSRTGGAVTFSTFWSIADAPGTWWEIGLFNAPTGGTLIARYVLDSSVSKSASNTVTVDYELQVS